MAKQGNVLRLAALVSGLWVQAATAQDVVSNFEEAIHYAVYNSPTVNASYHNFQAVGHELRSAKGDYFPRLDLEATTGRVELETPVFPEDRFNRDDVTLTMTQMLFDGFATRNRVRQLDHTQRAAYYELKQAGEEVAFEAARAYIDVLRYQSLVKLAEDNLVEHHRIYRQVEERANAGVSRTVDLEQANARMALADFNLLQEVTNLHDVVARFQRVVGAIPADNLAQPGYSAAVIPTAREDALRRAYDASPVLQGAMARLAAAGSAADARKAPYMPRLDFRLRGERGHDLGSVQGRHDEAAAELVLSYNLFRGGADIAARKQFLQRREQALDDRIQACRNVRQALLVAFTNIDSNERKLVYLVRNELSIAKARIAYRKQFDIGQRTLLDLLDSENEYFDVRRSLVNAQHDVSVARLRTIAAMGLLIDTLEASKLNAKALAALDGADPEAAGCPLETGPAMAAYYHRKERLLDQLRAGKQTNYRLDVRFSYNSAAIDPSFDQDLRDAAQYLRENPVMQAKILGHTDALGSDAYNLGLSRRRAYAVKRELVKSHGIAADRLQVEGLGESTPVADNSTADGRAQNRRVEFVPIKPPPAMPAPDDPVNTP